MKEKSQYKTRQREEVLRYLEASRGTHVTALQVCDHLRGHGMTIGTATVYRQLERLVDEGTLNKYTIDSSSPACFEYVDRDDHVSAGTCFHCKCSACGRLLHLHCEELEGIAAHLGQSHHFFLDPHRTVFYGLCEDCRAGGSGGAEDTAEHLNCGDARTIFRRNSKM